MKSFTALKMFTAAVLVTLAVFCSTDARSLTALEAKLLERILLRDAQNSQRIQVERDQYHQLEDREDSNDEMKKALKTFEKPMYLDNLPQRSLQTDQEDDKSEVFENELEEMLSQANDVFCKDKDTEHCATWASKGYCEIVKDRMREMCQKTCGMCKAPAPPACSKSEFGCCWDEVTPATGPNDEGCRECVNVRSELFCWRMRSACDDPHSVIFMRDNCAQTCGYCSDIVEV